MYDSWRRVISGDLIKECVVNGIVLAWLVSLPCTVHADPVHLQSASHVVTSGGSQLDLPPGYFLDQAAYAALDVEVKRLQTVETKLTAENASIRKTLSTWEPPTYLLVTTFIVGIATGIFLIEKL